MTRILIWNEFRQEKNNEKVAAVYPNGIHEVLASFLKENRENVVRTATLDEPECGLTEEILNETDVLLWWGHKFHQEVPDQIAERVRARVNSGMGFIALHSAHESKPFKLLMGTSCSLKWRVAGEKERAWNISPQHPIARGVGEYFELPHSEMYGERFDVPKPDDVIFISWYAGGNVMRTGCTWQRGNGKIFSFLPGHETYPIYYDKNVQQVIKNAVEWCKPQIFQQFSCPKVVPLEKIEIIED